MNRKTLLLLLLVLGLGFAYYQPKPQPGIVSLPIEQLVAQNDDEMFEPADFSMKPMVVEQPPLPSKENYSYERKDTQEGKELSWDYRGSSDFKVKGLVDVKDPQRLRYRSTAEDSLGKAEMRFSNGRVEISTKGEVDKQGKASGSISISGKFP